MKWNEMNLSEFIFIQKYIATWWLNENSSKWILKWITNSEYLFIKRKGTHFTSNIWIKHVHNKMCSNKFWMIKFYLVSYEKRKTNYLKILYCPRSHFSIRGERVDVDFNTRLKTVCSFVFLGRVFYFQKKLSLFSY